jgi:two-component system response regulator NreC
MEPIRVLLAEDHTIVRKGLLSILADQLDIEVVGEAENGREALRLTEQLHPDVVVMDIAMPLLNGLEATRQIKRYHPDVKVLVLTMHTDEEYVCRLLQAGASGYVVKQAAPAELLLAVHATHRGDLFLSPAVTSAVIAEYLEQGNLIDDSYDVLTDREREVLQLLVEGYSNREIADTLTISIKTVQTHRSHLMNKLGIENLCDLVKYAIQKGILPLEQ